MGITFKQIGSGADVENAERYVTAYLRLFNIPDNLKFLSYSGTPFDRDTVAAWLRDADRAGVAYHTAIDEDGEICGIVCLRANLPTGAELMALVVEAGQRRAGLGGQLLEVAVSQARDQGCIAITATVFADNASMLSLAVKHSFKPYKIGYRTRWDGEDIVYLRRCL